MLVHHRVPSMKQLGVLLLDASPSQGHQHEATGVLLLPLDGMLVHHRVPSMKQLEYYYSPWMGCKSIQGLSPHFLRCYNSWWASNHELIDNKLIWWTQNVPFILSWSSQSMISSLSFWVATSSARNSWTLNAETERLINALAGCCF